NASTYSITTSTPSPSKSPASMLKQVHEFEDELIYGDTDDDAKGFDGLHVLTPSGQKVSMGSGTSGAALSLKKLDEMIDKIRPGKPDFLLMTRRTRRGISAYARALTSPVAFESAGFG